MKKGEVVDVTVDDPPPFARDILERFNNNATGAKSLASHHVKHILMQSSHSPSSHQRALLDRANLMKFLSSYTTGDMAHDKIARQLRAFRNKFDSVDDETDQIIQSLLITPSLLPFMLHDTRHPESPQVVTSAAIRTPPRRLAISTTILR